MKGGNVMQNFIPFIVFSIFGTIILLLILHRARRELPVKKQIKEFAYHADNNSVREFINNLERLGSITNSPSDWDTMRAAFELVNENNNVSIEMKIELRKFLMGMGVNRLQKIVEHKR